VYGARMYRQQRDGSERPAPRAVAAELGLRGGQGAQDRRAALRKTFSRYRTTGRTQVALIAGFGAILRWRDALREAGRGRAGGLLCGQYATSRAVCGLSQVDAAVGTSSTR